MTGPQVYAMLENETLWEAALHCHAVLKQAEVAHAVCGGVAVCLHGYRRNTVDVDVLIRKESSETVRRVFEDEGLEWIPERHEFVTPSKIPIPFLLAGDRAGSGSVLTLPDPAETTTTETIDGLPVLRLSRLFETKIACGEGNPRRTHKDFADVVELIAINHLDGSFARFLHRTVRKTYRQLARNARGAD